MPLFDFNAPSGRDSSITTSRFFWIFWACTIPLTLVVLILYAIYLVIIDRRRRREDERDDNCNDTNGDDNNGYDEVLGLETKQNADDADVEQLHKSRSSALHQRPGFTSMSGVID